MMCYLAVVPLIAYAALLGWGVIPDSLGSVMVLVVAELAALHVTARALRRRYVECYRRQQQCRRRVGRA